MMNVRLDNNCILCTSLFARHQDVKIIHLYCVLAHNLYSQLISLKLLYICKRYLLIEHQWFTLSLIPRDAEFHYYYWICSTGLGVHLRSLLFYTDKKLTAGWMNDYWLLSVRLRTAYSLWYKNDFILIGCSLEEMR